jgi:glycyl-tRNA synthetase alpha chain
LLLVNKGFLPYKGSIIVNLDAMISILEDFWREQGCSILPAYDMEVGAGTMAPYTFFNVLSNQPSALCYVQPSRRPTDGRYGENPNRVFKHHQMQVIIKPSPSDIQEIYIKSLEKIGLNAKSHDIRFIEDNWEAPTLGAWGVGWEVWLDGMEITQFTYFQQAGGFDLKIPSVEITYGLERISLYIQEKNSIYDMNFGHHLTYRDLRHEEEAEQSKYCHDLANKERLTTLFELCFEEGESCLSNHLILPGYDYALKCSHFFNILDARGALSVTERARYLGKIRSLTKKAASLYRKEQNEQ